jgi:putative flippase GtrA
VSSAGVLPGLLAKLTEAPAGRRSLFGALVRFGVTGVLSVAADVGVLSLLHSGLGVRLLWSTLAAYAAGLSVNYSLNRNWTFRARAGHRRTLVRYATLVGVNVVSTLVLVLGLTHLGLYYLVGKLIAVVINAGMNFLAGRYWVFR